MDVGLTFDLRDEYLAAGYGAEETAEFDQAETIDALEGALRQLGFRTDRIGHVRQLARRLVQGDRWDLVFNICEGLRGVGREAQVPALLDAYGIGYTFSDPLVMSLTLHKGMTKRVVRDAGLPTARFLVVSDGAELSGLDWGFPLFVKPVAEGTGKGITTASRVADARQLEVACRQLLARYQQPVLVEPYLPGREFTVGLWGSGAAAEVIGTLEVVLRPDADAGVYTYANKELCEERVEYRLVAPEADRAVHEAERIALAAWRGLGCRDAGRIDLRCDAHGQPQFLEANPLAGLHPSHSDLPILCTAMNIPYVRLIERIVQSALERIGLAGSSAVTGPAGRPACQAGG